MELNPKLPDFLERIPEADRMYVQSALNLAHTAHVHQKRLSNEPYIYHPIAVAALLADIGMDTTTIIAGILHDLPEDTDVTVDQIRRRFGKEVSFLVEGVTKLSSIRLKKSWFGLGKSRLEELPAFEQQVATLRKMFLATSNDIRVIVIKLADRLHNMRTLEHIKSEGQLRIARETLDIYAPLADRLGIGQWKGELEDLAFPYVYPDEYKQLLKETGRELAIRQYQIVKARKNILKFLSKEQIKIVDIHGRVKRHYSLWKKLQRHDNDLDQIYDLVALRIVVKDEKDCYNAMSIIHNHWRPLPNRIKDYIAMPKPNGYRSLHTTVKGPGGHVIEIQIRDEQMHHEAEQGIAAHWAYNDQKHSKRFVFNRKTQPISKEQQAWFQELARWQSTIADPHELKESLAFDFFKGRIFVFTPQGDVKDLPYDSTPVDFAYAVHSGVGNNCVGARVNGKMVSLDYHLKNGDVIEIITSPKAKGPTRDWLNFVRSSHARNHIRRALK